MTGNRFARRSANESIEWSNGPQTPSLQEGNLHVWLADLSFSPEETLTFSGLLSDTEIERSKGYRLGIDSSRFIARRGILRLLLGRYLQISPGAVNLITGKHGKPRLSGDHLDKPIEFSVSSSSSMALFGFSLNQPVGVDIERVDLDFDYQGVISSYFLDAEQEWLQSLQPSRRRSAFYLSWVRKEAYLKGMGIGFSQAAQLPAIPLPEPAYNEAILLPVKQLSLGSWFIYDLHLPLGYMGSLAVMGKIATLECWKFSL